MGGTFFGGQEFDFDLPDIGETRPSGPNCVVGCCDFTQTYLRYKEVTIPPGSGQGHPCDGALGCGATVPPIAFDPPDISVCLEDDEYHFYIQKERNIPSDPCPDWFEQIRIGEGQNFGTNDFCDHVAKLYNNGVSNANGGACYYLHGTVFGGADAIRDHEDVHFNAVVGYLARELLDFQESSDNPLRPMPKAEATTCLQAKSLRLTEIITAVSRAYENAGERLNRDGHQAAFDAERPKVEHFARLICLWAKDSPLADVNTWSICSEVFQITEEGDIP